MTLQLGSLKCAWKLNSNLSTLESCSFWVTDTGNINFSTQIHCFHQVLASWLSSRILHLPSGDENIFVDYPPCHTSKVVLTCRLQIWTSFLILKYGIKAQKLAKFDNIAETMTFCMFFSFYSIFCLGRTKNEFHICNLHAKTQLLMYDKGGVVNKKNFISRREMEDSQEARTWWKQWIWVEKFIFPVSVTQREQLSGVLKFEFNFHAHLRLPKDTSFIVDVCTMFVMV